MQNMYRSFTVITPPNNKRMEVTLMSNNLINNNQDIVFYSDEDGNFNVEVLIKDEDVWLNTKALSELLKIDRSGIIKHINDIYKDEELSKDSTYAKIAQVQKEGNRNVSRNIDYYNLDMIISLGFRVNSKTAIKFRTWANNLLKEYIIKGYNLNEERFLKANRSDIEYFDELLEKIKLIRTSERMFYQKITDIFAECSIDYVKDSETASTFYKTIQNKFHYAITHQTAAEIIYNRADSTKEHMNLTSWKNSPNGKVLKSDVIVAKNYLDKQELEELNDLVNMYLDTAENRAKRHIPMKMQDWIKSVEDIFKINFYDNLTSKGSISHEKAIKKAEEEFEKYKVIQDRNFVSDFDILLLETQNIKIGDKDKK